MLHVVTDDAVLARPAFEAEARAVLAAGGARMALHLRGRGTGGRRLFRLATGLRPHASEHGAMLVVNDRIDVALAAGADGVQLGGGSLSIGDARRLAGESMAIGVSIHGVEEAASLDGRPDWLLAGTIWPSASHPDVRCAGTGLLRALSAAGTPVIAIGGVTPERAPEARAAGAHGVAVLGGIWNAPAPAEAVMRYLEAWRQR